MQENDRPKNPYTFEERFRNTVARACTDSNPFVRLFAEMEVLILREHPSFAKDFAKLQEEISVVPIPRQENDRPKNPYTFEKLYDSAVERACGSNYLERFFAKREVLILREHPSFAKDFAKLQESRKKQ